MTTTPAHLQPASWEIPALAWTMAQAYTALPSQRRVPKQDEPGGLPPSGPVRALARRTVAALWLAPMLLLVWMPVVATDVGARRLARRDRHALLVMHDTARRTPLRGYVFLAAGTAVAVSLLFVVTRPMPQWAVLAIAVPLLAEGVRYGLRHQRISRGLLKAAGGPREGLWVVGQYAAHPRQQGHGSGLTHELLQHLPDTVELVTAAGSPSLADGYRDRYGFVRLHGGRPLQLKRPTTA